uniref:Cobalt-precorrin-5B C(1)-methyltransferase n=1 Tax=Candidatus Kentrum sp. MB TaxID=2138164 RepID=A0A450XTC6_9GAMM|nr:MAG: cobalt-precorrin-5B (C1)-methyltransferase [Candidatus Kentron sp. MB]VFK32536.1 MAG: cobalt-precorrin-5B (C1)-methyltransferase [Candidatus Kentron sp. MB]VFK75970.1 MAG: cobalt-precorrin-5B (C1)-methyltransferase [Candidatus Kentron sp. MB]
MRTGFTTGACAAAAARAAVFGLIQGKIPDKVECLLPNGQWVHFTIAQSVINDCHDGRSARAVVIKDAGTDPDCTHGARLIAEARLLPDSSGEIRIAGGDGVGVVTLPGLGLELKGPAINPVPRRNIEENVRAIARALLVQQGIAITISVPGGQEMAKKTLNPRLGILGGISILGTTGIVHPWSTAAFRSTVVQGIRVAAAQGHNTVALTTGGRTERFAMGKLPHLPSVSFVQMGDFLRYALDTVVQQKIPHVIIAAMVGKLAKMAQGETITHANRNPVNMDLVAEIAAESGADAALQSEIRKAQTARYAGERMTALGLGESFHKVLAQRVIETITKRYPGKFTLRVLVCDFEGTFLVDSEEEPDARH